MILKTACYDFIIAGGGLQAGLLMLAIHHYRPDAKVLVLEKSDQMFGNHTWSCHQSDVTGQWQWLREVNMNHWPGYTVRFPDFERHVSLPYLSISSSQMRANIECICSQNKNIEILNSADVTNLSENFVATATGEIFQGREVIDCRGKTRGKCGQGGFQKFIGLEIELPTDWPDRLPVLMDANIDQSDGFRFLYVLPFGARRVLVEDTFFSDNSHFDQANSLHEITEYLNQKGFSSWKIIRRESGCLPMPYSPSTSPVAGPIAGGYAGGWFHAATGYSFPLAARFADVVASSNSSQVRQQLTQLADHNRFRSVFSRFLNRLLFRLVSPSRRFEIFRRFYRRLPNGTIQRFYAHTFTRLDAARILLGKPPGGLTPIRFVQSYRANQCLS